MTTSSPYQAPDTQSEVVTPVAHRPTIPKTFGVIHIVYASIGILGVFLLAATPMLTTYLTSLNPLAKQADVDRLQEAADAYLGYLIMDGGVRFCLGLILLFAGIKLRQYKRIGFKLTKIWAIPRIIWAVVYPILSYSAVVKFGEASNSMSMVAEGSESLMQIMQIVGLVLGVAMVCVYPILSMIFLRREDVQKSLS